MMRDNKSESRIFIVIGCPTVQLNFLRLPS